MQIAGSIAVATLGVFYIGMMVLAFWFLRSHFEDSFRDR